MIETSIEAAEINELLTLENEQINTNEIIPEIEKIEIEVKDKNIKKINEKFEILNNIPAPSELNQEELFRGLVDQYQKRLYRFVIKYIDHPDDAADITQQAFVEAAKTITSFRGDSKLSTWLFGIAMNMVRNYLRKMIEQDLYELPVLSYQERACKLFCVNPDGIIIGDREADHQIQ